MCLHAKLFFEMKYVEGNNISDHIFSLKDLFSQFAAALDIP